MNRLATLLAWGAVLVLPACAQQGGTGSSPAVREVAACDAARAQDALGKRGTPEVAEAARREAGAQSVRIIGSGQVVTKEYLFGRLNLQLDAQGNVAQVFCG